MRVEVQNNTLKALELRQKETKAKYLLEINEQLCDTKTKNDRRIPHQMVLNIAKASISNFPWITRNIINQSFKKF